MSTLAVTNTFVAGAVIRASEHNQNFADIIAWANGNITDSNLDVFSGPVTWSVTTNNNAIIITNVGTEGSISVAHNGTLASGKSAIKLTSNAAQTSGTALLELAASSVSNAIPLLKLTDAGTGGAVLQVVSTTKASQPVPKMTSTQRAALSGNAEGMEIYNSTTKRKELYDGTNWVDAAGRTGEVVDFAGSSLPADRLLCDGTSYLRTDYPALFAKIGITWGAADGTHFNVPDARGRTAVGAGTGSGLTARTLGSSLGDENLQSHTHTGNTNSSGAHNHRMGNGTAGGDGFALLQANNSVSTGSVGFSGSFSTESVVGHTHGFTSDATGAGGAQNMPPSFVVNKAIII